MLTSVFKMQICAVMVLTILGCTNAELQRLSCKDRRAFVYGHNIRRQKLARGEIAGQPAAGDMKYMIWDDELAAKASAFISTYPKNHNPDKSVGSKRFTTGENLYWYSTTDRSHRLNIENVLKAWFEEEHIHYTFAPIASFTPNAPQIGHYTQMAWADTTHVGCAVSRLQDGKWQRFFVVCNYGPAGNVLTRYPYKPDRANKKRSLLCVFSDKCKQPYGKEC